jgi:hypothetical protein
MNNNLNLRIIFCCFFFFFSPSLLSLTYTTSNMAQRGTQDLPPSGGYAQVKYRRYLPKRGPSGAVIFAGITAICTYGFYQVARGNLEKK